MFLSHPAQWVSSLCKITTMAPYGSEFFWNETIIISKTNTWLLLVILGFSYSVERGWTVKNLKLEWQSKKKFRVLCRVTRYKLLENLAATFSKKKQNRILYLVINCPNIFHLYHVVPQYLCVLLAQQYMTRREVDWRRLGCFSDSDQRLGVRSPI